MLEKYADIINEREKRTIGEIKSLVDGSDLTVQSFVDDFRSPDYSFENDYEKALKQTFDYVKKEVSFVDADLNINYCSNQPVILIDQFHVNSYPMKISGSFHMMVIKICPY